MTLPTIFANIFLSYYAAYSAENRLLSLLFLTFFLLHIMLLSAYSD